MPNSWPTSTSVLVIDANVAVWAVLPQIAVVHTVERLDQWCQQLHPLNSTWLLKLITQVSDYEFPESVITSPANL